MIYVGIDDTDTLDDPGTNQLARHLVRELAPRYSGRMIVRHQLLEDPRVPCTKKNGCASILLEPVSASDAMTMDRTPSLAMSMDRSPPLGGEGSGEGGIGTLINALRDIIVPWCPKASDPGLCVATEVPQAVIDWGMRCKRELVTQAEARRIADDAGIHLEGLGGTQDGVIGALAAIGLMATKNDGRVVHFGSSADDWYDVTGCLSVDDILSRGVDEIRTMDRGECVLSGTVDIGKRLRPNYRDSRIVLFVVRGEQSSWQAVRVV